MCVIAVKAENLELDNDIIEAMWNTNSDGAGFMTVNEGNLLISKGHMTLNSFKEAFEPYKKNKAVLHFRIKTHGHINEANTHPFDIKYKNKLVAGLVHNGTFNTGDNVQRALGITEWDDAHSDTWHYNKYLFSQLPPFWWKKPLYTELIKNFINFNKVVIMDNTNNITIINSSHGTEFYNKNLWTSNIHWKNSLPQTHELAYKYSYNSSKKNDKTFHSQKAIEITVDTEFTYNTKTFIIPKGTKGWISKYFKYENHESFWSIRLYPNQLPNHLKEYAFLSFPCSEKTLKPL